MNRRSAIRGAADAACSKAQKAIRSPNPVWFANVCSEDNIHVSIEREQYRSADGQLMPSKKDQAPPDLSYFKRTH